ncbi:MAG TPA: glycosyltransferase family A protein [Pyrinomonadaceae bacterium]|nr:glycosyltransferase family A protein [Pyrinomonadaceae bacterium]
MELTSIIITTHNRPQLLERAVASAFLAGTNVEVIVVDDASTDDTAKICRRMSGIKYVRVDRNQQVAGARNLGLLVSIGEYITFLDDDDVRLPGSLDRQVKLLEADPKAGLIYGQAVLDDQSGQPTPEIYPQVCPQGDVFWKLLGRNFIPCGSVVFRRSCLDRVGLLDHCLAGLDDWDLWIRIAELYPMLALAEPVTHWRKSTPASQQGTSRAAAIVSKSVRQFRQVWQKLPRVTNTSPEMKRHAWQRFSQNMGAHLSYEVLRSLRHRQPAQATKNLFALLRLGPLVFVQLLRANDAHSPL